MQEYDNIIIVIHVYVNHPIYTYLVLFTYFRGIYQPKNIDKVITISNTLDRWNYINQFYNLNLVFLQVTSLFKFFKSEIF